MRILHTSDWHFGKTLENVSRLDEQREFVDELCSIVERENIDLVVVAGDVFDTYTPSSAAEELFYQAVERLSNGGRRGVVVIAGNHDSPERLCAAGVLAHKNGIILLGYPSSNAGDLGKGSQYVKVIDSGSGWLELSIDRCKHNVVILALPYPSEARLDEILTRSSDEEELQHVYSEKVCSIFSDLSSKFRDDTVNIAVSHIFLLGGKESDSERTIQVGGAMTVDPGALPPTAHFAALGHLHRPQRVKGSLCPAYYSGSPLAYSFSETDYCKAVFLIDAIPGSEAEIKELALSCGKPLKRWIASKGIDEALKWCEEGRDTNAWIDLEIYTDRVLTSDEQKMLRELNPGILNIRPKITAQANEAAGYENRESKKVDELFKEYYKFRTGVEASEELMNTFLDVVNDNTREEDKLQEETA